MAKLKLQLRKCRHCERTYTDDEAGEDDATLCIDCECELDANAL
jgi:hypothetical protein